MIDALADGAGLNTLSLPAFSALPAGKLAAAVTADQIAALDDAHLGALTATQIAALAAGGDLSNLSVNPSANQIAALGTDIAVLTGTQLASLTPTQLGGLSETQVGALSGTQLNDMGTTLASLSDAAVAAFTASQLDSLGVSDHTRSPAS